MSLKALFGFALASLLLVSQAKSAALDDAARQLSHDIFKQLIEINTTDSVGSTTVAAEAMRQRFLAAGFPAADMALLGPNDRKGNLVLRYHGTGQGGLKPVLIICHLDVVEAKRSDWTTDPFQFLEKDGYFYGRGTQDMKSADAIIVTDLIRLRNEGFRPDRDIILALTADEEGGTSNGVEWLLKNHRDLVEAQFALNPDSGGVEVDNGKAVAMEFEATEKLYADFELTSRNPGGHSSLPTPDNAIYHIADSLDRLEHHVFTFELNNVTRAFFQAMAKVEPGEAGKDMEAILQASPDAAAVERLSQDPRYNSTMRTTCVATRLSGGHANNALPQTAQAIVNCRILPGHSPEEVRKELLRTFDDAKVEVAYIDALTDKRSATAPDRKSFTPPPLQPDVMNALHSVVPDIWGVIPTIPIMEPGASDSIYTMAADIPSYGISGVAIDRGDVRAHGKDERVRVKAYYDGVQFYYLYLKALTAK